MTARKDDQKKAERRKKIEKKKAELQDTDWTISVISLSQPNSKPKYDVLMFQNGKVTTRDLSEIGFEGTNLTLSSIDEEYCVWETMMQSRTGSGSGIVFIRGEWKGDFMSGTITRQMSDGKVEEYFFSTASKSTTEAVVESISAKTEPAPQKKLTSLEKK